ncbi:MAG: Xaa-Pro dipeptidase [Aquimonas sp.]|nr:Xaa-Pro dipeptidase [Aquimonas sp.]
MERAARALDKCQREHLLIAAGVEKYRFLDDRPVPFETNPHFKAWLPLLEHPGCWLKVTPGHKPHLFYFQPEDFWHKPPADPEGYWTEEFTISVFRDPDALRALLPPPERCAIVGEADAAREDWVPDNPPALLDHLHYHRAFKTGYELALMREASRLAVAGHRAAEAAFRAGASEWGIHHAYLRACGHGELDLPYASIVGLNANAAILHYQHRERIAPPQALSLLIDAGASASGYAADITRTYSGKQGEFSALVEKMDALQRALVEQVRPGVDYRDLHRDCHRRLAVLLAESGLLRCSPEQALEQDLVAPFFPHGLGHLIGLQVHDVAGFAASEDGGRIERPEGHPYLRLTRRLEPGMVVTIEPGLYFIDSLLAKLRARPEGAHVDWARVEALAPYGGIRIEDDVACTADAPENLSRDAFAAA